MENLCRESQIQQVRETLSEIKREQGEEAERKHEARGEGCEVQEVAWGHTTRCADENRVTLK